jgi:hypothetical protein
MMMHGLTNPKKGYKQKLSIVLGGLELITLKIYNIHRFLTLEDGTDKLSRNFGKKLPLLAA